VKRDQRQAGATDTTTPISEDDFVTSRFVRRRYGDRSEMWLNRNLKAKRLPKPDLYIGQNRYWRLRTLIKFEQTGEVA
jgi:hypothetical protein